MTSDSYDTFEDVKKRLDEIVDAVGDESLSLDDALSLYEEAVGLGLRASDLLEEHIEAEQDDEDVAADGVDTSEEADQPLMGQEALTIHAATEDAKSEADAPQTA